MTLGALIDWFVEGYHQLFIRGITDEARERGIRLLFFNGKQFNCPHRNEFYHNRIYQLIDKNVLDGLIIPASMMGFDSQYGYDKEYFHMENKLINSIPSVTISFSFPPHRSLTVDNRAGFKELLEHMILTHGYKKFAFIYGRQQHPDSTERFNTYKEVLLSHNIEVDEQKITGGSFMKSTGIMAVATFLDERKLKLKKDIEAIICANDAIAMGLIEELNRRNYDVPGDVAVTGFDGIEIQSSRTVAITTVALPIYRLGRMAVKTLALDEKPAGPIPTYFIPRQSCGCIFFRGNKSHKTCHPTDQKEAFLRELPGLLNIHEVTPGWEKFVNILLAPQGKKDLEKRKEELFSLAMDETVKGTDVSSWLGTIKFFEENINRIGYSCRRETLYHYTHALIVEILRQVEQKQNSDNVRQKRFLRFVVESLNADPELNRISSYFSRAVRERLNIGTSYLFLYETKGEYKKNFLLLDNHWEEEKKQEYQKFFDFNDIVHTLLSSPAGAFVIQPLVFDDNSMGFFILEHKDNLLSEYESLRIHLGAVLQHSLTIIEVEKKNRKLNDLQTKLVRSAHQSGMAQIAGNLMHSVGNLSNGIFISLEQLSELLQDNIYNQLRKANDLLDANIEDPGFFVKKPMGRILPAYYRKLEEKIVKQSNIMKAELKNMNSLFNKIMEEISSQEKLTQGLYISERINIIECLENSMVLNIEAVRQAGIRVRRFYPPGEDFKISCFYNKLLFIFTKLIEGAIARAGKTGDGTIDLSIAQEEKKIILIISNNGIGIGREEKCKIFNQSYNYSRGPEDINYHLIANSLSEIHASIKAESKGPDKGAAFIISFPASEQYIPDTGKTNHSHSDKRL